MSCFKGKGQIELLERIDLTGVSDGESLQAVFTSDFNKVVTGVFTGGHLEHLEILQIFFFEMHLETAVEIRDDIGLVVSFSAWKNDGFLGDANRVATPEFLLEGFQTDGVSLLVLGLDPRQKKLLAKRYLMEFYLPLGIRGIQCCFPLM